MHLFIHSQFTSVCRLRQRSSLQGFKLQDLKLQDPHHELSLHIGRPGHLQLAPSGHTEDWRKAGGPQIQGTITPPIDSEIDSAIDYYFLPHFHCIMTCFGIRFIPPLFLPYFLPLGSFGIGCSPRNSGKAYFMYALPQRLPTGGKAASLFRFDRGSVSHEQLAMGQAGRAISMCMCMCHPRSAPLASEGSDAYLCL